MNILLIAPLHKEEEYLQQKSKIPFLEGQGQQSWVDALEKLGHVVKVFRYSDSFFLPLKIKVFIAHFFNMYPQIILRKIRRFFDRYYYLSLENVGRSMKLFLFSKKIKLDLIIISGGISCIFPSAILSIKKYHKCHVLLFSGINPLYAVPRAELEMVKKKIVDVVVENDEEYAKLWRKQGAGRTITLPISSVDPQRHTKIAVSDQEKKEYSCDVCFVGTLTKKRQKILKNLLQFDIKIWGDVPTEVGLDVKLLPIYLGSAHGIKMVKIYNCAKIVLNFLPEDTRNGGNMRMFEIPGCGALQLVNKNNQNWFTDGKEIVTFENEKDLKNKIFYYLSYEEKRKKISQNGYKKAHREHTYDRHFKKLLSQI